MRGHLYFVESFGDALRDLRLRPFRHSQSVSNVLFDGEMRKERVVLKNGVYAASIRRLLIESLVAHPEFAGSRGFESRNDAEQSRFA